MQSSWSHCMKPCKGLVNLRNGYRIVPRHCPGCYREQSIYWSDTGLRLAFVRAEAFAKLCRPRGLQIKIVSLFLVVYGLHNVQRTLEIWREKCATRKVKSWGSNQIRAFILLHNRTWPWKRAARNGLFDCEHCGRDRRRGGIRAKLNTPAP